MPGSGVVTIRIFQDGPWWWRSYFVEIRQGVTMAHGGPFWSLRGARRAARREAKGLAQGPPKPVHVEEVR